MPRGLEKKKVDKNNWKWFGHSFADLCVYTIVVCLLRHPFLTTTKKKCAF